MYNLAWAVCREFICFLTDSPYSFHPLSDDSEGDHAERLSQGMMDVDESDKEVVSISKGKHLEDTEERSNNSEESDGEEKSNFEAEVSEDMESTPQDDKKGDDGEESHSEEKEVDESSEALGVEANKEKSDSEGNQDVDIRKPSRKPKKLSKKSSNAEDADISDDEPLVLASNPLFSLCIIILEKFYDSKSSCE
jgi:sister-chromatid-cohesion protein PDS5